MVRSKNIPLSVIYFFSENNRTKELFYYISLFEKAEGGYLYKSAAKNLLNKINKDSRTINKRIQALIDLNLLSESKNKYKLVSIVKIAEFIEGTQASYESIPYYYGVAYNLTEFKQQLISGEGKYQLVQKRKEADKKYQLLKAKNIEITEKNDPRLYSDSQGNKTSFVLTDDQGFYPLRSQAEKFNCSHVYIHNIRKDAEDMFLMESKSYFCPGFEAKKVESIQECLAFGQTQRNPDKYHAQRFIMNEDGYYSMRMEKHLTIKNFKPTKCYSSKLCRRKLKESVTSLSKVVNSENEGVSVAGTVVEEFNYLTQHRSFSGGGVTNNSKHATTTSPLPLSAFTSYATASPTRITRKHLVVKYYTLLNTQYASYFDPKSFFTGGDYSIQTALDKLSSGKCPWLASRIANSALRTLLEKNKHNLKFKLRLQNEINCLVPDSEAKLKLKDDYQWTILLQWKLNNTLYTLTSEGKVIKSDLNSN